MIPVGVSLHLVNEIESFNPLVSRAVVQPWLCYVQLASQVFVPSGVY